MCPDSSHITRLYRPAISKAACHIQFAQTHIVIYTTYTKAPISSTGAFGISYTL